MSLIILLMSSVLVSVLQELREGRIMWGIPFNKMPVSSCIATLLPRCFGDEVTYLHVNRFKEIYKTYLKKMHLFWNAIMQSH